MSTQPDEFVGVATALADGTISLALRAFTPDGRLGETFQKIAPNDKRYADIVRHLGGLKPGESKPVPAWPAK